MGAYKLLKPKEQRRRSNKREYRFEVYLRYPVPYLYKESRTMILVI